MPIITPSFPAFNTTHNVNLTHLEIINKELNRAYEILERINSKINDNELKDKRLEIEND